MFKNFLTALSVLVFFLFVLLPTAHAIEDPFARPNNKFGIHILFTSEIPNAAKLVNSSGGDWGYITIPIQIKDKNKTKWQRFMTDAKKYHLIPIVRLATENDPTNAKAWRKPQLTDIIDFAQFLNSLDWPTKNRYVLIFNEVNRGDEWGGAADPAAYADILSFAVTVFKSKNPDYFIISSGLDNAAPNQGNNFINEYDFMHQMNDAVPGIFYQIDGLASHAYSNPGFSQAPNTGSTMGVASFHFEQELAKDLNGKTLPIFITETGWSADLVSDTAITQYYQTTFDTIWNDPSIVAITPFLLEARGGPFQKFSFLSSTGSATQQYTIFKNVSKTKGSPTLPVKVLAAETVKKNHRQLPKVQSQHVSLPLAKIVQNMLGL